MILTGLEKYFTVNFVDYQDASKLTSSDFSILSITTGGAERLVIQYSESLPRPATILADRMQSLLTTAPEVSSWLRGRGMKSETLHGRLPEIIKYILVLHSNFTVQRNLPGMYIGVIGTPSSWLIVSNVDYLLVKRRRGAEYTDVFLDRIYEYYNQITGDKVGRACAHLAGKALAYREASPENTIKVMRLYRVIRKIVDENRLGALASSCSRPVGQTGTTGCPALFLLNDEGIIAGREGDLQSIFTTLATKVLTGKLAFITNPSMTNAYTNELILAHYTIDTTRTEQFIIRNHFETESSIGIQEILPTGDVTIAKCGGECLDEYYLGTGTLTENTNYINMYCTQVHIKMNALAEHFLRNPLGNHHIMLHGNYEQVIDEFLQSNGCKRIE